MRKNSVLRRVLLPLALVLALFSISAPSAHALTEHHYGGFLMKPYYPYQAGVILPTITGNIAAYTGAGSVGVCQETYDYSVGVMRKGCGVNAVGNALNLMPYYGNALQPYVVNNSPSNHTIHGWYYTG